MFERKAFQNWHSSREHAKSSNDLSTAESIDEKRLIKLINKIIESNFLSIIESVTFGSKKFLDFIIYIYIYRVYLEGRRGRVEGGEFWP